MEDSLKNNTLTGVFATEFSNAVVTTKAIQLGEGKVHAVFVEIDEELYLKDNWIAITNTIALHFQSKFKEDFERWNLYLFFLLPKSLKIKDELKYTIENDTFSSRKIIDVAEASIDMLIQKHIHNNLTLVASDKFVKATERFEYNSIILSALKNKIIKRTNILPDEQMKTYDELFDKLNKEDEI